MLVSALKLVYKSGEVWCVSDVAYNSPWGCHGHNSFKAYPLNVITTDRRNNLIFTLQQFIELRGSVGEELKNWSESDNQGRVCVDVFAYVIGDTGVSAGGSPGAGTSRAQSLLKKTAENEPEQHHVEELEVNKR